MSNDRFARDQIAAELDRRIADARASLPPPKPEPSPEQAARRLRRAASAERFVRGSFRWWAVSQVVTAPALAAAAFEDLHPVNWTETAAGAAILTVGWVAMLFSALTAVAPAAVAVANLRVLPRRWIALGLALPLALAAEVVVPYSVAAALGLD